VRRNASTCVEYLNLVEAGFSAATNRATQDETLFVARCYTLRALEQAQPASVSWLDSGWPCQALAEIPPLLEIGPNQGVERARRQGESWQTFDAKLKCLNATDGKIEAEDGIQNYGLQTMARGDFNDDGIEDIALVGCAHALKGTNYFCRFYILTRLSKEATYELLTNDYPPYALSATRGR
jgi:hypothetical protein